MYLGGFFMTFKKFISVLLLLAMLIVPLPTTAEELPSVEGIPIKVPEGYTPSSQYVIDGDLVLGEFHGEKSNLARIFLRDTEGKSHWAYVDRKGNVSFHDDMFEYKRQFGEFYNGLAAVVNYSNEERKYKLGYIDEKGNEIIPEIYDAIDHPLVSMAAIFGNFYGDYTYVFKNVDYLDKPYPKKEVTAQYAKIDRSGNLLSDWSDARTILTANDWGKSSTDYKNATISKELMLSAPTQSIEIKRINALQTEYKNISITSNSDRIEFEEGTDAVVLNTTDGLIIADLDQFKTKNQSQLKIVDWRSLDNAHCIEVSLRNNTSKTDTSNYAVVFFSDHSSAQDYHKCEQTSSYNCNIGEVHFLDSVTLSPGASKYIEFSTQYDGDFVLNNKLKVIILKFDSEAEKLSFKESVPFYTGHPDKETNYELKRFEGEKWFKDTFNLSVDERWRTYEN